MKKRIQKGLPHSHPILLILWHDHILLRFCIGGTTDDDFIDANETAVIVEGVHYLRIEGTFMCLIAGLFLLYGFCIKA